MIVFHPGIGQDVPSSHLRTEIGVAEDQLILAFVQFTYGFGRSTSHVYSVTPCLQNGLQGKARRQFAVKEQDPGQIQRRTANTTRIIRLLHASPSFTLTEIADSLATNFLDWPDRP